MNKHSNETCAFSSQCPSHLHDLPKVNRDFSRTTQHKRLESLKTIFTQFVGRLGLLLLVLRIAAKFQEERNHTVKVASQSVAHGPTNRANALNDGAHIGTLLRILDFACTNFVRDGNNTLALDKPSSVSVSWLSNKSDRTTASVPRQVVARFRMTFCGWDSW